MDSRSSIGRGWLAALVVSGTACAQESLPTEAAEAPAFDLPFALDSIEPVPAPALHLFEAENLSAYFTEGPLLEAKAAYDSGQYRVAFKKLADQGDALPVRYLRALAALKAGDASFAATELASLASDYLSVRDGCLYNAGLAEERLGHFSAAIDRHLAVDAHSRLYPAAMMAASRDLLVVGDVVRAGAVLAPLLDGPEEVRADALWQLANVAERRRDHSGARTALEQLWALGPRFALSSAAYRRLGGNVPVSARIDHAEAELNANFGPTATAELWPILKRYRPPDPLGCRAHFLEGKALRKARHHAAAIAELLPVVHGCKDPQVAARALYVLGYSQSVVDPAASVATYEALASSYPTDPLADDALFLAADGRARAGDVTGALAGYAAVTERYPDSEFAAEAQFRAFWLCWQARRFDEGLARLEPLESSHRPEVQHRARYWRARAMASLGRTDEVASQMAALAADGTAGYYGEMARQRLAELAPARVRSLAARSPFTTTSDALWPMDAGPLAADLRFKSGVELVRLGLPGAAAELLAIDRSQLSPAGKRLLFQVLYSGGYQSASTIFAAATLSDDDGAQAPDARLLWELTFPKSYRAAIERQGRAASVDPDLLQALIREESHFASRARSSTGALGLAQLMPATARLVAGSLKLRGFTTASLLQPDRNIQLGAAYLAQLLHQFSGNRVLAVAAYNAGPNAVKRWLAERPDASLDEWVEEIPVQETREYVKKVLGSCRTYGQLYDTQWPEMLAAVR